MNAILAIAVAVAVIAFAAFGIPTATASAVKENMNASQIAGFARQAGFSDDDLTIAVAVALAESHGDVSAHNVKGEDSRGLWQISVNAHPEFSDWQLFDPQTNANAAYSVWSDAGSFRPWSTFNTYQADGKTLVSVGTGVYRQYLNAAQEGVNA